MADKPTFPVFVLARSVDAAYADACLDMPENTPLSSVTVPVRGNQEQCLAWFTARDKAEEYARAAKLKACCVAIKSAAEAAQFLSRRQFFGVAVNPTGVGGWPQVYLYGELTDAFRRLSAEGAE
jgi:hypothetical protein